MISIRFFNNIRYKFSLLLDQKSKNKFIHIILLSIASAFLELIGVSLLLYTILSIFEPNFIQDYQLTKDIYDKLQLRNEQRFVLVLSAFLFLIYIFKNVVLVYISKRQIQLSFEINAQISDDNYKQLMQSQLNYFRSRDSSSILNEMMSVTMNLSESILLSSALFISEWIIVFVILFTVLLLQPWLFLFAFVVLIPTAGLLIYVNKNNLERMSEREHQLVPHLYENIISFIRGIATIKLWNGESYFFKTYQDKRNEVYDLKQRIHLKSNFIPVRIYEVIAVAGLLLVIAFGTYHGLSISSIVAYITIYAAVSFRLLPSINRIITSSNSLVSRSHVLDFLIANQQHGHENQSNTLYISIKINYN